MLLDYLPNLLVNDVDALWSIYQMSFEYFTGSSHVKDVFVSIYRIFILVIKYVKYVFWSFHRL